ncbi:MAG TPA: DUF1552 domain-containing protein [Polyangiaceae bacterium]|nr:DUF1552 domain-containing protein [Polyangiaceae bacterium]
MRSARFLSRRTFLQGAAGAAVGLPLLESIGASPLLAQSAKRTTRFLSFHSSCGVETDRFWPAVGALSEASFAGKGTEALAPFASRILIPRGVHGYPVGTWTGHLEGTCQALTAAPLSNELAQGRSIDQVIADALNPQGREALVVRPGGRDLGVAAFNSISYRSAGQMANAESNPFRAYRSMMGMGTPAPAPGDQAAERLLARRQSVLDLVREEFQDLQRIDLGKADRDKLQQHFQLIRDVENGMTGEPAIVACNLEPQTASELEAIKQDTVESNDNFPIMARLFAKIVALSLACQYTRSAVLQWGAAVAGAPMFRWDGINHNYRHHPLSHGTTDDFNEAAVSGYKDMLFAIDRWNIGEFAKLLGLLDAYKEQAGTTLLDNTVVLYTNEFSHGQGHTTGDLPMIIAGGAGYFPLGRSVVLNGSTADIGGVTGNVGQSHRLLCTVLNAAGVPTADWQGGTELLELKA